MADTDDVNENLPEPPKDFPTVGMPATYSCWTDCHPAHVSWVSASGKTIRTRDAKWQTGEGFDYYAQGPYIITPDPEGCERTWTLRKDGRFRLKGSKSYRLSLGHARYYQDPHF